MPPCGVVATFGLTGQVALVTGATRGIGLAIAHSFADAGAAVVVSSDDAAACAVVAAEVCGSGGRAIGVPCDVRLPDALAALAAAANDAFGRIDVLVCNAGIRGPHGPLGAATAEAIDDLLAVNLRHALTLTTLVAPQMAARRHGSIILTSSIAGRRGNKAVGLYGMAKAALSQLARNLAVEWGPHNVRANSIAPGLIATSWSDAILSDPEASERRLSLTPLRRIGEPWEIAAAALFLASPASAFVTGHELVVDGGTVISDGN